MIRDLARAGRGSVQMRWSRLGLRLTSAPTTGQSTPRNLMRFKGGTRNVHADNVAQMNDHIWVGSGSGPAWLTDGTYLLLPIPSRHRWPFVIGVSPIRNRPRATSGIRRRQAAVPQGWPAGQRSPSQELRRIAPRIVPAIIEFVFGDLTRTPRKVGKPLKGELDGSYGVRRGPYRILCSINDAANRVEILRVDHRPDVYRNG